MIEKKWIQRVSIPPEISEKLSEYPLPFRQILFNRGIKDQKSAIEFLSANEELHNPFLLEGMEPAVRRIKEAINKHERIVIFGDYDVDGITSSVLLTQVIRKLDGYVKTYIPNRFEEGYGLSRDSLKEVIKLQPDLIITVDCGIRSIEEIDIAKKHHIDIIITDHHQHKEKVPNSVAVICSKQEGDTYPYKELAGVGVAYKLAQALLMDLDIDWINIDNWLDLVAIGTVADVAPLNGENRAMVRKGIDTIRQKSRLGILALCEVSKVNISQLNSFNIGYMLGPRLNAAGRLSSALKAYRLLDADTNTEAKSLAQFLDDENRERQRITKEIQEKVESQFYPDQSQFLISSFDTDYNEGVLGLAASRLTESFYRPSVIGTIKDGVIKASCRSLPEVNIIEALDGCSELLLRYGGHAMAAGLTVDFEKSAEFLSALEQQISDQLNHQPLTPKIFYDAEVINNDLNEDLYRFFQLLEPTGNNNSSPILFMQGVKLLDVKRLGSNGEHLKFFIEITDVNRHKERKYLPVIAFRFGQQSCFKAGELVDLLFIFEENEYNGKTSLQLKVRDMRMHDPIIQNV